MGRWEKTRTFFRAHFFSGLLVVIPLLVSTYVVIQSLRWLYRKLEPLFIIPELGEWFSGFLPDWFASFINTSIHMIEFGLVVIILVFLTALVGMITRLRLVHWILGIGEQIVAKIPLMGTVYSAVKQLMQAIFSGKGNFSRVVMIEFPRPGIWCLAFVSRQADRAFAEGAGKKLLSVFLPTTPNPTSGYLLMIPVDDVIELDITVEQAFKIIMSAGMVLAHEEPDEIPVSKTEIMRRFKERITGDGKKEAV